MTAIFKSVEVFSFWCLCKARGPTIFEPTEFCPYYTTDEYSHMEICKDKGVCQCTNCLQAQGIFY